MTKCDFQSRSVNQLAQEYVSAAIAHGNASTAGDHSEANRQHDTIQDVYRELRSRGKSAQNVLLGLLEHPNEAVRGWAAFHALEFAPNEAEPVLEVLSESPGISGFNAEMTLKEWRKGTLKFP
jgi:hypothetical protein